MQEPIEPRDGRRLLANLPAKPGPYVKDGFLGFVLRDGCRVLCTCIGEPHASRIVETFNAEKGDL
jgi:hypothetical protein